MNVELVEPERAPSLPMDDHVTMEMELEPVGAAFASYAECVGAYRAAVAGGNQAECDQKLAAVLDHLRDLPRECERLGGVVDSLAEIC